MNGASTMFKRSAATLLAAVAATIALAGPSHAAVSRYGYTATSFGETKHAVQDAFGTRGTRTLAWSDHGAWIQKSYRGVPIPDQWQGTDTEAVMDYLWTPGVGWVLEFKTWCVWDNLNRWVCS